MFVYIGGDFIRGEFVQGGFCRGFVVGALVCGSCSSAGGGFSLSVCVRLFAADKLRPIR